MRVRVLTASQAAVGRVLAASQADEGHGISCVPPSVFNQAAVVRSRVQDTLVRRPSAALHSGTN